MYLFFKNMPWPLFYFPMLQAWIPGGNGLIAVNGIPWTGHLWSVSTEVFFYAIFPFAVFGFRRLGSVPNAVVTVAANLLLYAVLFCLAFRFGPRVIAAESISAAMD
jgi:peptidoglycan/LPS O-acetylase OafA/YrhL